MTSKFKKTAYLPFVALIAALVIGISHLVVFKKSFAVGFPGKVVYFILFTILISLISKVRTKTITVKFSETVITVKQVLGLGQKHMAYLTDITGYYTSTVHGRHKDAEYLYIMQGKKKIAKISSRYHANYNDIKAFVHNNFRYLGNCKTNIVTEITDFLKQ